MSDYLPEAVVVEILVHTPPTTLLRCMSVCKAWNKIIKSQTFISSHLQHSLSKSKPTSPLILITDYSKYCSYDYIYNFGYQTRPIGLEEEYILYSNIIFPLDGIYYLECPFLIPVYDYVQFVGSLHGIVCLYETFTGSIVLWNPLIQRRIIIQAPRVRWVSQGFGFDSKKNDYIVIRMCFHPAKVELYSLNDGAWRVIDDVSYTELGVEELSLEACFLNGNVHWIGKSDRYAPQYVFMFNVEEEKFKKMELPAKVGASCPRMDTIVIQGCLSVLEYYRISGRNEGCNIWMMREYGVAESWTKISTVQLQGGIRKVFGLSQSAKVLVRPHQKEKQVLCSLYTFDTKSQELEMTDLKIQDGILLAFDCTESLLLHDKESCIMQDDEFGEVQDSDWIAACLHEEEAERELRLGRIDLDC